MHFKTYVFLVSIFLFGCAENPTNIKQEVPALKTPHVIVLGVAQDAGYPQAGCQKACCQKYYEGKLEKQHVSCIGVVSPEQKKYWVIDATPDFPEQLKVLEDQYPDYELGGIFLTHAHIGHYTGLMHLGREAMGTSNIPVYAMPKMISFLSSNGPWSQLVKLENIKLMPLASEESVMLAEGLEITPTQVPHRDEYSETVGYYISGEQDLLFIPDIDKWGKWEKNIVREIQNVDHALLDGSYYENGEIPGRDMSLIPHPFIKESLSIFEVLSDDDKSKVHFIHFNHTNPIMNPSSSAVQEVHQKGMGVASEGMRFALE